MKPRATSYVWGMFCHSDTELLAKIQRKVQLNLNSPRFDLHITLAGPFAQIDASFKKQIKDLCRSVPYIKVQPLGYDYRKKYYKSFFISIEQSTILSNLRNQITKLEKPNKIKDFYPHISLAYGSDEEKEKNDLIYRLPILTKQITIDKVCIVDIYEEIALWKVSDFFYFNPKLLL